MEMGAVQNIQKESFHLTSHDGTHEIFLARYRNYQSDKDCDHSVIILHDVTDSHQRVLPFAMKLLGGRE